MSDSQNQNPLHYADETDKAYGLAGMAISLMVWDAEELLLGIDIDAPVEEALQLSQDYHLCLSPRTGVKAAWEQSLKRFQLTAAMTVANIACRQLTRKGRSMIDGSTDSAIRSFLSAEGEDVAQLEADEVSKIYGQALTHCSRIFRHPGVSNLASQLASRLSERRSMNSLEVLELLSPLNRM